MQEYKENELLMLSGIQHFYFCRRQWALIHLENQWQENVKTIEGNLVHKHCHDESFFESRGNTLITRGFHVHSYKLGIIGQCDVLEFHKRSDNQGAILFGKEGTWDVCPVEYKLGKPKDGLEDVSQLVAQALCLEEMFSISINEGYLYYAAIKRRQEVLFTEELKNSVIARINEMHSLYQKGYTPIVKTSAKCRSCSLQEICLPKLLKQPSVKDYYNKFLEV